MPAKKEFNDPKKYKRIMIHLSITNTEKGKRDNDFVLLSLLAQKKGKSAHSKSLKQFIQRTLATIAENERKKQTTLFTEKEKTK